MLSFLLTPLQHEVNTYFALPRLQQASPKPNICAKFKTLRLPTQRAKTKKISQGTKVSKNQDFQIQPKIAVCTKQLLCKKYTHLECIDNEDNTT